MQEKTIRLVFDSAVAMEEVELTFRLAVLATSCLHGIERVRHQTRCRLDTELRTVDITIKGKAGRSLALIFGGFTRQEFGADAVRLKRPPAAREGD